MWDMLKGWLDPRTQAKIEFLRTGSETKSKLLEFIDAKQLPMAYGGSGAASYTCKEQAEFTSVPRAGQLVKTVAVAPQHKLQLDSYFGECEILLEVTAGTGSQPLFKQLVKHDGGGSGQPLRLLLEFEDPASSEQLFTVSWTNTARFYSRPLTYVFTVVPIATPAKAVVTAAVTDDEDSLTVVDVSNASSAKHSGAASFIELSASAVDFKDMSEVVEDGGVTGGLGVPGTGAANDDQELELEQGTDLDAEEDCESFRTASVGDSCKLSRSTRQAFSGSDFTGSKNRDKDRQDKEGALVEGTQDQDQDLLDDGEDDSSSFQSSRTEPSSPRLFQIPYIEKDAEI